MIKVIWGDYDDINKQIKKRNIKKKDILSVKQKAKKTGEWEYTVFYWRDK